MTHLHTNLHSVHVTPIRMDNKQNEKKKIKLAAMIKHGQASNGNGDYGIIRLRALKDFCFEDNEFCLV